MRETLEGKSAYDAPASFFHHSYTLLNLRRMLSRHSGVDVNRVDVVLDRFKHIVHNDGVDGEACPGIDINNTLEKMTKF